MIPGEVLPPAPEPCRYCPLKRSCPSGVWDREEYEKLLPYDGETWEQPVGVFLCHVQSGRICAGWAALLDVPNALCLRLAALRRSLSVDVWRALCGSVRMSTPLFRTFREAAAHGLRDIDAPGPEAREAMEKLGRIHPRTPSN